MTQPHRPQQSWATKKSSNRLIRAIQTYLQNFGKAIKKGDRRAIIKNTLLALVAAGLFGFLILLALFAWYSKDLPDPGSLTIREVPQATKIYDRSGEHLLYEIFGDENRTLINMQEGFCNDDDRLVTTEDGIPLIAVQATIAAEDRRFCSHQGFSFKGLARAVIFRGNRGGGSTLTQQLVKNAILSNERTLIRKFKELIISVALERRYSKDEILQIYFNEIPYGSTYYGIETASRNYFDKPAANLTLAEAATLAALPQLPTYYVNNPDRLQERRNWILDSMADEGFITREAAEEAKAQETPLLRRVGNITAPHFVLWVKEQLEATYGQRMVEQGGLKVITSLDHDMQGYAEEAVVKNKEARGAAYGFNNSGLVALDPKTGHILAMVGSADYFDNDMQGQVNVTLRPLQPGSSFKPIVYAAGFEKGYTPNSILWDTETDFPTATGNYHPRNYSLNENGPVSIRKALQGSLNIPAVKMLYLVGVSDALDFAERIGYSTLGNRSNFGLAIVLGGAEVKLLDHVNAYAAFANEGVQHDPVAILKVEDAKGSVLEEWKESEGDRVMDVNVARMTSNVLSDNAARAYVFGPSSYLQIGSRPVAAKTGTTNDYNDAWTVGYTPSLVAGVWTGNTDGAEMRRSADGSVVAAPIWNEFMRRALEGTPVESFTSPSIPQTGKPILDGQMPMQTVVIDRSSGKLATEYTPEHLREEKMCGEFHDILHYVNRGNPTGPVPSNPERDPHYNNWEAGVRAFIEGHNANLEDGELPFENCEIPTESDDVHHPSNQPQVRIESPTHNQNVERQFFVDVDASAPRGISRLEFTIDGNMIAETRNQNGTTINLPAWVESGRHTLEVIAYDDVDNAGRASVQINVGSSSGFGSPFIINTPSNLQTLERGSDPFTLRLSSATNGARSVMITQQNTVTGAFAIIREVLSPNENLEIPWTLPEAGFYTLRVVTTTNEAQILEGPVVKVLIKNPLAPPSIIEDESENE